MGQIGGVLGVVLGTLLGPLGGMGGVSLFDYIFYIVMTVLAFFLTGWIADEKLSV